MFISFFAKCKNFLTFRDIPKLGCYKRRQVSLSPMLQTTNEW